MTDAPIAGWYPDPRNSAAEWRWWNGRGWTHEVAPRQVEAVAPVRRAQDWGWEAPAAAVPASSPDTVWIWLLAFSICIFGLVAGVLQGVGQLLFAQDDGTRLLVVAVALVSGAIPLWVFADLDGRALRKRGLPVPSVLWMLLLPPLVYFVVRGRILRRVGAGSKGPDTALAIVVLVQLLAGAAAAYVAYQTFGIPAIG